MARLKKDVKINDEAFDNAEQKLSELMGRADTLKENMQTLYDGFANALKSETGIELRMTGQDVVIKPIENLGLVLKQVHDTLDLIKGDGYYHEIFKDFEALQTGIAP